MSTVEGRGATLVFYRHTVSARVFGSLVLAGAMIFGLVMGELAFRSESLRCEPPTRGAMACSEIDSWPVVPSRQTVLSPVVAVRTRASTSSRGTNVVLLLEHADATVSSFEGVGALGDRAETVALQMNRQLASGQRTETFAMRGSAPAFAIIFLLVFLLIPLVFAFEMYARVQIFGGSNPRVFVGRGLVPSRQLTFGPANPPELVIESRVVGGDSVHVLSVRSMEAKLDLASMRDADACRALQEKVRSALQMRA